MTDQQKHDDKNGQEGSEVGPKMRFGRCLHPGADDMGYSYQHYLWLDKGRLNHPSWLVKIIEFWGLEEPNLVINLVGGWQHPEYNVRHESLVQPELAQVLENLSGALKVLHQDKEGGDDPNLHALGEALANRLVSIFVALLDACSRSNSWLILDGHHVIGQIPYLLERAFMETKSRPIILAFVDQNTKQFRMHTRPEHEEAWSMLQTSAKAMQPGEEMRSLKVSKLPANLFPGSLNALWPPSCRHVADCLYGQWFFRGATHYMFTHSEFDKDTEEKEKLGGAQLPITAMPFPLKWAGSVGHLFVGGDTGFMDTPDRLIQRAVCASEPAIILKHTGGASDFFGNLVEIMQRSPGMTVREIVEKLNLQYPFWYDPEKEWLYGMCGLKENLLTFTQSLLGVPESHLKTSAVVINSWLDDPQSVLRRLCHCFAMSSEIVEPGSEVLDDNVIMEAWRHVVRLKYSCQEFGARASQWSILTTFLSLLTATMAAATTFIESRAETEIWAKQVEGSQYMQYSNYVLMMLPAVTGLVMSILARLNYVSKWASTYLAAAKIESDIYKFRAKVLEYDPIRKIRQHGQKKQKVNEDPQDRGISDSSAHWLVRRGFVKRVAEIFSGVMTSDLQDDSISEPRDLEENLRGLQLEQLAAISESQSSSDTSAFSRIFQKVPQQDLGAATALLAKNLENYGTAEPAAPIAGTGFSVPKASKGSPESDRRWLEVLDAEDLINRLSADEYYHYRVLTKLSQYRRSCPQLASRLKSYEILIFTASVISTLFGAMRLFAWIPLAVTVSAVLTNWKQFEGLSARISAMNVAIEELSKFESLWPSLSFMEKRTRAVKAMMVDITERVVLQEVAAFTGQTLSTANQVSREALQHATKDGKPNAQEEARK